MRYQERGPSESEKEPKRKARDQASPKQEQQEGTGHKSGVQASEAKHKGGLESDTENRDTRSSVNTTRKNAPDTQGQVIREAGTKMGTQSSNVSITKRQTRIGKSQNKGSDRLHAE